jgi:alpha-glucosidase
MKAFTQGGKRIDSAYNFDFLYAPQLTASGVRASLAQWSGEDGEGWPSWAFSNHDAPRAVSRWTRDGDQPRAARLSLLLLLALRGNPIIYQGEELGLPEHTTLENKFRQDPTFARTGGHRVGRDGCRVPLPCDQSSDSSGFSATGKSWLPQPESYGGLARSLQEKDASSTLTFYKQALALRKQLALGEGYFGWVSGHTGPESLAYENSGIRVIYNFGKNPIDLGSAEVLISSQPLLGGQLETNSCVWIRP